MHISDAIRMDLKTKEIESYINTFVIENMWYLGNHTGDHAYKELTRYSDNILDDKLKKRWIKSIKKHFGK